MIGEGGHAKQILWETCCDLNIIGIGDNRKRKQIAEHEDIPWDSYGDNVGRGSVALEGSVIGCNTKIGDHVIINHNAVVDHDAVVENYAHVAPGACVLGGAKVGEGALIGSNAVVLPLAEVPPWAIVRAGSVFPVDYEPQGPLLLKKQEELLVTPSNVKGVTKSKKLRTKEPQS